MPTVSCPNTLMLPDERIVEADDGAQQHRFARARSADHAQHFAALHIQIEMIVDDLAAEAVHQPAHADDDIVLLAPMRVFLRFCAAPLICPAPKREWKSPHRTR